MRLTSVLLPAPLCPTRPIISPGSIVRSSPCNTSRVPYLKRTSAQLDVSFDAAEVNRLDRLGDAGRAVENLEDAMGAGGGALHRGDHAAHRVDPGIEPADVGDEHRQRAELDFAAGK